MKSRLTRNTLALVLSLIAASIGCGGGSTTAPSQKTRSALVTLSLRLNVGRSSVVTATLDSAPLPFLPANPYTTDSGQRYWDYTQSLSLAEGVHTVNITVDYLRSVSASLMNREVTTSKVGVLTNSFRWQTPPDWPRLNFENWVGIGCWASYDMYDYPGTLLSVLPAPTKSAPLNLSMTVAAPSNDNFSLLCGY